MKTSEQNRQNLIDVSEASTLPASETCVNVNTCFDEHQEVDFDSSNVATADVSASHTRRDIMQLFGSTALLSLSINSTSAESSVSDPIFSLIENHRRAYQNYDDILSHYKEDDPRREVLLDAKGDEESDAGIELLSKPPASIDGAIALLKYATELEIKGYRWPDNLLLAKHKGRLGKPWSHFLHQNLIETFSKLA